MPLSQTGSYTNQIRCRCPKHDVVLHENTYQKSYVMTYVS
ncbi:hypothetical protein F383_07690 [Gossypium arboreum]|uniref:Uncharacterized protein n=1 Tax=Gossypium arboreum TaxID=29729 RepID=A0A0B0P495_GOSAR|nr:hypothetical protein F383_07690 [Gossypium arboreum]